MAVSRLNFETNYIYILLSDRGDSYLFHWALYLAKSKTNGIIFHLHNPINSTAWAYESQPSSDDVPDSNRLLLGLEVGGLEPVLHDALGDRLAQIPIEYSTLFRENITCRVWIKEALFALNNEGYIKLVKSVDAIEEEAKVLAMINKTHGRRTVTTSSGSIA